MSHRWFAGLLLLSLALPCRAQEREGVKVGLVLSGGSAKGLVHVGVIRVLEEAGIPIHVVTGTSMGAIVGGLYAMGYTADMLEHQARSQDWSRLFSDVADRTQSYALNRFAGPEVVVSVPVQGTSVRLPSGAVAGQQAISELSRLAWPFQDLNDLSKLPIPFTCIATNLRTGEARALTDIPLPMAIRASLSLPTIFAPVEIDGVLYVDGGLSRNLPAQDARALGADFVIGVDVSARRDTLTTLDPTLVDVVLDAIWFQGVRSDARQRELVDVLIKPVVSGLSVTSFDEVDTWIERGRVAALAALPSIQAALDSLGAAPPPARQTPVSQPKMVERLEIRGVDGDAASLVRTRLDLEMPLALEAEDVVAAIERVYATGLFELVSYRIVEAITDGASVLQLTIRPYKVADRLGVGIRYDSHYKAEMLFTLTLLNRLRFGSTTEFRARLGTQSRLAGRYTARFGAARRMTTGAGAGLSGASIRMSVPEAFATEIGVSPDLPIAAYRLDVLEAELTGGYGLSSAARVGAFVRTEYSRIGPRASALSTASFPAELAFEEVLSRDQKTLAAGLNLDVNTMDRSSFPASGTRISARMTVGISNAAPFYVPVGTQSGRSFQHLLLDMSLHVPVRERISVFWRMGLASGAGPGLPIQYYNFLGGVRTTTVLSGGFFPLYGRDTQQQFGRKLFLAVIGTQWTVQPGLFLRVLGNVGGTLDLVADRERDVLPANLYALVRSKPAAGFGIELGTRTPVGPARIILSGGGGRPLLSIDLGYAF